MNLIIVLITTFIITQGSKWIIDLFKHKKINWLENGGMPSTHTAVITSLTLSIYLLEGFSNLFYVVLVLSIIIINDALNVRWEASKHSLELNKITKSNKFKIVGHKPLEVLIGLIIGIIIPLIIM